jgi:hypothetical protein
MKDVSGMITHNDQPRAGSFHIGIIAEELPSSAISHCMRLISTILPGFLALLFTARPSTIVPLL